MKTIIKYLTFLAFAILPFAIFAQKNSGQQLIEISKDYFIANQSESTNRLDAVNAIDGNINTSTLINNATNSNWWQVNMKFVRKVAGVKVAGSSLSQFYIFTSKAPFNHINLNSLLQDPWVKYTYVNTLTSQMIPIEGPAQYIMIHPVSGNPFSLNEVSPLGYESDGPNAPFPGPPTVIGPPLGPPYGTCGPWWWPPNNPPVFHAIPPYIIGPPFTFVGPGGLTVQPFWSNWEKCGDGLDNDLNGLIDCEDYPCGPGWYNVVKTDPTCPICNDGQICIYSYEPVTHVSIDGGSTWVSRNSLNGENCFNNLLVGTFDVLLTTAAGCTTGETIKLGAPKGNHENCFNGGFEEGTFQNWTGGLASGYSTVFNNDNFDLNDRHSILQNPFTDPLVPFIQGFDGVYTAKLGNSNNGSESERLRYCFTVDNTNKDFSFNYATVLETPGHSSNLPFFEYKVYNKLTPSISLSSKKTDTSDPFLTTVGGLQALGWQCVDVDLSNLIGQEVCAEFITSDCGCSQHFGYGYVEGLCSSGVYAPDVKLIASDVYCKNQPISIKVDGVGFNQFKWTISKIGANGVLFDTFESPITIGFDAKIDDLKSFYESNSGFGMQCPQNIKIIFDAISDCGTTTVETIIEYNCNEYTIDYCDPLFYCFGANTNQLQIQGENNCNNCQYNWTSQNPGGILGMINNTSKYPTLDRSIAYNAFDKIYDVVVTTPESCIYEDKFSAKRNPFVINILNIDYGYCAYTVTGNLIFEQPIDNNDILAMGINILNNESFPLLISGTGNIKTFEFTVSRDMPSRIKIEVQNSVIGCMLADCKQSILLDQVNAPFYSQWKSTVPNIFSPNGDGTNDEFFLQFRSVKENRINCQDMNFSKSSVFFYKLEIFDRWGNLIFINSLSIPITNTTGILGDEIKWDGKFNGQTVVPDVYTWKATVQSCYDGSQQCNDCGPSSPFQKCADSGNMIFTGDVTVVL